MNTLNPQSDNSSRPAFSLIEVLISVMILSLGLLGLAAVFPVIIRQQRLSGDATQGLIVAKSAEAFIRSHTLLNKPSLVVFGESDSDPTSANRTARRYIQKRRGWDLWRFDCMDINGNVTEGPTYRDRYGSGNVRFPQLWDTRSTFSSGNPIGVITDRSSANRGTLFPFGSGILNTPPRFFDEPVISLRDRLWPEPYSAVDEHWQDTKYGNEPRFVWDMAMMRDEAGTPEVVTDDRIRVAVFVRRIDSAMRIPIREVADDVYDPLSLSTTSKRPEPATSQFRNVRLADVLLCNTGAVSENNRTRLTAQTEYRVPIAVDASASVVPGEALPTQDGNGNYAALAVTDVEAIDDRTVSGGTNYNRIIFPSGLSPARLTMLRQPNQRFADNMGNVYTVVKVDEQQPSDGDNRWQRAVIVTPFIPQSVREMSLLSPNAVQIVFSPTPPAAVTIFTIEPK